MTRLTILTPILGALLLVSAPANGQGGTASGPHMIIVKLVATGAAKMPFAFEPASVTAQMGDTLRFVEAAASIHNVRFTKQAPGAKLGAAAISPYLTALGQAYTLVIDRRFTEGTYEYGCEPHMLTGMKGTLLVKGVEAAPQSK